VIVPGALAAGGTPAHGVTSSLATIVIVVLIVIAAAPLVRHRRATARTRRPSRTRVPAKSKRSDYYWPTLLRRRGSPGVCPRCIAKKTGNSSRPAPTLG
jgi:hypothetical protein